MYEDRRGGYGGGYNNEVKKGPKIYVSNLSSSTTEDELNDLFGKFGKLVEVSLKRKETITFAFIEFESASEAEAAIDSMNRKTVAGSELKVQFARGERRTGGDRGRGYSGDRGSFRPRGGDYGDRAPRRDFGGDRPRGCFNCQKEGHMARECPEPRKPREFNNDRGGDRGGYRGRGDRDNYGGNRRRSASGSKSRSRSADRNRRQKDRKRRNSSDSR